MKMATHPLSEFEPCLHLQTYKLPLHTPPPMPSSFFEVDLYFSHFFGEGLWTTIKGGVEAYPSKFQGEMSDHGDKPACPTVLVLDQNPPTLKKENYDLEDSSTHVGCTICKRLFNRPAKLTCGHIFCAICIQKAFEWQLCRRMFAFNLTKKPHSKSRLSMTSIAGRLKSRGIDPTSLFRYSCPSCRSVIKEEPLPIQDHEANFSCQTQGWPLRCVAARQYFRSLFSAC